MKKWFRFRYVFVVVGAVLAAVIMFYGDVWFGVLLLLLGFQNLYCSRLEDEVAELRGELLGWKCVSLDMKGRGEG